MRIAVIGSGGPISMSLAYQNGLTRGSIRAAISAGTVRNVRRGVIESTQLPEPSDTDRYQAKVLAYAANHPGTIFRHRTAAILLGLPGNQQSPPNVVHIIGPRTRNGAGIKAHELVPGHRNLFIVNGIQVTAPLFTAAQLTCSDGLHSGIMALDFALRDYVKARISSDITDYEAPSVLAAEHSARHHLDRIVRQLTYRRGIKKLRQAVGFVSVRSESPAESRSHVMLQSHGFLGVRQQVSVIDGDGVRRRLDFLIQGRFSRRGRWNDQVRRRIGARTFP